MKQQKKPLMRRLFQFSRSRKSVLILQPLLCAAIQQLARRVGVSLMVLCAKKTQQLAQPLSCTKRPLTKTLSASARAAADGRVILHKSQSANSIALTQHTHPTTHPHEQYHLLPQCDHIRRPMRRPHSFNSTTDLQRRILRPISFGALLGRIT
jgi:hypothetical protein